MSKDPIWFFITILELSFLTESSSRQTYRGNGQQMFDSKHGVKMGVSNGACDDAKTGIEVDYDGNPTEYTCYHSTTPFWPNPRTDSVLECVDLSPNYYPQHHCLSEKLSYNVSIPTFGDHRPLWPIFGEYRYVPPQRWLHNIEHGSVVMLYHPCAHNAMVHQLKSIVKSCIRKHIITPNSQLKPERPLALIAWGCKIEMSVVNEKEIIDFIKEKGLKGPEGDLPKEGQYEFMIIEKAQIVSDLNDSKLCPRS